MRALADADRIRRFMAALAANVELASPADFIPVGIEPELYRYPAVDPVTFRRAVEAAFGGGQRGPTLPTGTTCQ